MGQSMQNLYLIPACEIRREYAQLNSRFIATLAPAFNNDEARAFTRRIRLEFSDATHHVSAYIIGGGNSLTEYCSDDGEPQGTAGRPALAVLRGSGLGDAALVITRYFGGSLLGTGGLVKAYTESAQLVVTARVDPFSPPAAAVFDAGIEYVHVAPAWVTVQVWPCASISR